MEINRLLLWTQAGLLGAVTPHLRAVFVDIDTTNKRQIFYFYYDCDVTDKLFDLASTASTEASCSCDYFSEENILKLKFPQKMPIHGRLAYLRKEKNAQQYPSNKYMFNMDYPMANLLLYVQQAMLGAITENIRKISLEIDEQKKIIRFHFIYDKAISEEDNDNANKIIDHATEHFLEYAVEKKFERVDYPKKIPDFEGRVAYLRYEDEVLSRN